MVVPILHHPFTAIIAAPSCSGKSTLVFNIIRQSSQLLVPSTTSAAESREATTTTPAIIRKRREGGGGGGFDAVFIIYRSWQPLYEEMQKELGPFMSINFFEKTFPPNYSSLSDLLECSGASCPLIVIDDGLSTENQREIQDLFTRHSHHLRVSVILLTQSIFDAREPTLRLCHRNAKILILFSCPRDQGSLRTLVYQMHPDKKKAQLLLKTMEEILQKPYSYIMIDFQQECPVEQRYKTNILSESPLIFTFPNTYCYSSSSYQTAGNPTAADRFSQLSTFSESSSVSRGGGGVSASGGSAAGR